MVRALPCQGRGRRFEPGWGRVKNIFERPMAIAFEKNFPEVILGLATIIYGGMLTFPPDSFQYAQGYETARELMPTWAWGLGFLGAGLTNFFAVLTRRGDVVRFTAKLLFFAWFIISVMFMSAAIFSPGWIMMLAIAILFGGVSSEYRTKAKWHDGTDALGPDL